MILDNIFKHSLRLDSLVENFQVFTEAEKKFWLGYVCPCLNDIDDGHWLKGTVLWFFFCLIVWWADSDMHTHLGTKDTQSNMAQPLMLTQYSLVMQHDSSAIDFDGDKIPFYFY